MKLFGTDGIRSQVGHPPITPDIALKIGQALGSILKRKKPALKKRHMVLIGKDTRLSGYMLEQALASGLNSVGVWVHLTGPLPTPGISFLAKNMRVDAGVILSASHNPYYDNGIKIFDSTGFKISTDLEKQIEDLVEKSDFNLVKNEKIGRTRRIVDASGRYIVYAKNCFPMHLSLENMKIVLDCAHGASYKVAPLIFKELGAELIKTGNQPDGFNINENVGALYPENLKNLVLKHKADLGIALDGDGDRVILCDEKGSILDGDHILAICALYLKKQGKLNKNTVVGTVMSNQALEEFFKKEGIKFVRTAVGDKNVVFEMMKNNYSLGGEASGHIVCLEDSMTGDGCLSALNVLTSMLDSKKKLSQLKNLFQAFPSTLRNIKVKNKTPLDEIKEYSSLKKDLENSKLRILVRYSGTENFLRIFVEGDDLKKVEKTADLLESFFKKHLQ